MRKTLRSKITHGAALGVVVLGLSACHNNTDNNRDALLPGIGLADPSVNPLAHPVGDATRGKDVFRFETFGNEGFWTRVVQLPQGIVAAKVTPLMALKVGLNVDIDQVPAALAAKIAAELKTDLSPAQAPTLNDPATTEALVEANAIPGFSARNVTTLNGKLDINANDIYAGESVGASCALCHSITDGSVYSGPSGGTIGKRIDGPTNHELQVGKIFALAVASRALYPSLALKLEANQGKSLSRKGPGIGLISAAATEVEVDAYLNDSLLYPKGMFDDSPDGNGAPMHTTPLFRTDLAAPWGSEGSIAILQNFGNLVYTALFDMTDLTTAGGRQFLSERGGKAGLEIADNYVKILASIGIPAGGANGYPFVGRAGRDGVAIGLPAGAKVEPSPIGMQVDQNKLFDMNAYTNSLAAPIGDKSDPAAIARGQLLFAANNCTSCHNAVQNVFVPQDIIPFNRTVEFYAAVPTKPDSWPAYAGELLADRTPAGLAPVRNAPGTFDDKMVIVDASNRGLPRGVTLPLLLDLARKPKFLHDDSVDSLDALLNPVRGAAEPHPFYISDSKDRADVVSLLKSFDDK